MWIWTFLSCKVFTDFLLFTSLSNLRILLPDVKSSDFARGDLHFFFSPQLVTVVSNVIEELKSKPQYYRFGSHILYDILKHTSVLCWDIMQPQVVMMYRRFGTTCHSCLHGSRTPKRTPKRSFSFLFGHHDPCGR